MEINKQLFEDVLSGKLKGNFVLYNGNKVGSEYLERRLTIWSDKDDKPYAFRDPCTGLRFDYYEDGRFMRFSITPPYNDIVDFIPNTEDMAKKKSYNVTLYYHTNTTVRVEAASEQEAIELARAEVSKECYTKDLLDGMQEDSSPDVNEDED